MSWGKTVDKLEPTPESGGMENTDCPWSSYRAGTLHFCEAKRCDWIVAPAETWSNLAYFVMAILIWRSRVRWSHLAGSFVFCAAIVGFFSFVYHMSHIWWFETLDLGSMLFLATLLLRENLIRLGWLTREKSGRLSIAILFASFAILFALEGLARTSVFGAVVVIAVWLEALLAVRNRREVREKKTEKIDYFWFKSSLALILIAYAAWWLDFARIVCDPENHFISGHAVWHVVNSFCFLTLHRFYQQFQSSRHVHP